eukprot:6200054-Pleurochrysis_carterae.AAC.1
MRQRRACSASEQRELLLGDARARVPARNRGDLEHAAFDVRIPLQTRPTGALIGGSLQSAQRSLRFSPEARSPGVQAPPLLVSPSASRG